MLKLVAFVALMLIVAQAQEHRCSAPGYFQANIYAHDHETGFFRFGRFSYDAYEERIRLIERLSENATRPQVDELTLNRERKRYTVDLKTRKCTVTDVHQRWHPIEAPEDARFIGDNYIGSIERPGEGVTISTWYHRVNETDIRGNMTTSFTREECVPYQLSLYGYNVTTKKPIHYHRTFFDVTIGLDDPDVFSIPKECLHRK